MAKFQVFVPVEGIQIFEIEAEDEETAMDLATEGEGTIVDNQVEYTGAIPVSEHVEEQFSTTIVKPL